MNRFLIIGWIVVCVNIHGILRCAADDKEKFSPEQIEFFENQIRPTLSNHCLECHGNEKAESELRLDSRAAILMGGASGQPAAVLGQANDSLIVQSIRHTGDYDMPPNKKLTDKEISQVAKWIEMGMPWPNSDAAKTKLPMPDLIEQHRQTHWSFQPIKSPAVPSVKASTATDLDKFVAANLESRGLSFSPRADKRSLIRRASFDLLGLPPTFEQVQTFVNDESPDAYAKLIDRLLASPQYGERWARHWLDVARYADTSGYTLDNQDNSYPFAFTYRDYVIDALNADLPYDQFIREQLAADYLDVPSDNKTLAALGFIAVGRKYLERPDTIDDQVDVVTRGLMGLTVGCARCHDHKYDAIPTEDYYSLYSVFENNYIPSELPLIGGEKAKTEFAAYFEKLNGLKKDIETFRGDRHDELLTHIHAHFADYLAHSIETKNEALIEQQPFIKLKSADVRKEVLDNWRRYFAQQHGEKSIIKPALELLSLPDGEFEQAATKLVDHWSADPNTATINSLFLKSLKSNPLKSKIEIAVRIGDLFSSVLTKWKSDGSKQPATKQFRGPEGQIARLLFNQRSPASLTLTQLDRYLDLPAQKDIRKLRDAVVKHNAEAPDGLARAMVLRDKEKLVDQAVMIRGNINRRGAIVPRQFVALLSNVSLINSEATSPKPDAQQANQIQRKPFQRKSGRLELAEKIASPDNPLTARVMVNRVWMHHFSQPLVDTPSDFGIRCEEPLQRELLDHLSAEFIENGWSIKQLHRTIMLSDVYCQTSDDRPTCSSVDPENRLLWKMNRRRLEFESLRDSVLFVSGQLDSTMHGKAIKLFERPPSKRRTVYGLIDRQDLPGLYRVFDLASPDQSAAKRTRTSVPQQSLFMMNSFFMIDQARNLVTYSGIRQQKTFGAKINSLYRQTLQRDPASSEIEIARNFMRDYKPNATHLGPWVQYAQMLLCTNEFEFVD